VSNTKFKPTLWCVCVQGPDDVIPAPDFDTARRWANRMNALTDAAAKRRIDDEHMPICNSVVIRWPHDAASHAEGPSDDDKWLLNEEEPAPLMQTWQPIVTAPKDEAAVLGYGRHTHSPDDALRGVVEGDHWWSIMVWDKWRAPQQWVFAKDGKPVWSAPTHWMPLPAAPKTDVPS
jgi:hypothetical protein